MKNEIWKDVLGYEGLYQVSNMGNVKSLGNGNSNNSKERLLKQHKSKRYVRVALFKNGKKKMYFVHLLVWTAFNGIIIEGYQINHIDENPENNRLENLNLMTPKENINWGTRNKRVSKALTNGKRSKPVQQYDLNGNLIKEYPSLREIQRQLNVDTTFISKCCNKKLYNKTAYGYIWRYKEVS